MCLDRRNQGRKENAFMETREILSLEQKHGARNYSPLEVVLTHGEGVWVYDSEGNRYLDCLSSYSALNQGHCHPRLVQALTEQASKLTLSSRAFHNDRYPLLLARLADLTGYEAALPMNTGVEAVETALKLARKWAYTVKGVPLNEAEIIVAGNNFHGRTITVVSFSTELLYREYFGPHTPGFFPVEYGDPAALEAAITPRTAAILLEPIQGEAGVIVPPAGYLRAVQELCQRNNVLLLMDEIQTGLGRTGKLFAYQHEAIRPDVVIIGKALGGGMYPVSSILADRVLMDLFQSGEHGSTFGGNPLGAAVAVEALDVLVDEKLIENAADQGEYMLQRLSTFVSPFIQEVRGKGLLIGIELVPEAGGARHFCEALKERGLLCKETHEDVIRFAPPLIIDRETINWALTILEEILCPIVTYSS
jgi:ornithine--oxo-acid transaminase